MPPPNHRKSYSNDKPRGSRPSSPLPMMEQSHTILGEDLPLPPQRLFERLAQIPGYAWNHHVDPVHSSYDHWHVSGVKLSSEFDRTPLSSTRSKESNGSGRMSPGREQHSRLENNDRLTPSASSSALSTPRDEDPVPYTVSLPVVARLSSHVIRLEREFHMLKSIIDTSDPESAHTVRPIDIIRLTPEPGDSSPLLVTLYENPGPNYLRQLISFGPAFFRASGNNDRVKQGPLHEVSLSMFLDFAIGACECLELLHYGLKTVHGEIRPDAFHFNNETSSVKLSNSGNGARSFDNALSDGWSALSRELGAKNKLQYIAPEQTGRLPTEPDSRTDVYALGVLFWSMLVGRPAFDGSDPVEVVHNVLGKKLSLVSSKRMDIPHAVSAVIQKMTRKQIDERYHTVSSVKWDLQQIASLLGDGDSEALKNFAIGQRDISSFFTLPTGMFGRTEEFEKVRAIINKLQKRKRISLAQSSSKPPGHHISGRSSGGSSVSSERIDNSDPVEAGSDPGSAGLSGSKSYHAPSGSNLLVHTSTQDSFHSGDSGATSVTQKTDALGNRTKSPADSRVSGDAPERDSNHGQFDSMPIGRRKVKAKCRHSGGCEIVTVSGEAGLGKSDLIQRLQPEIRKQGYVATARLDRSRRIPFEPFMKILASLLRQIFSERDVTSEYHSSIRTILQPVWPTLHEELGLSEQLIYPLGSNTSHPIRTPRSSVPLQVLKEGVESAYSSGEPGGFVSLSHGQSTKDFNRGRASEPVLNFGDIFVDVLKVMSLYQLTCVGLEDIQYADKESSRLLLKIAKAKVRCLLMLTGRQDEILSPDMKTLFQCDAPNITRIDLQPLGEDDVLEYVAATMHQPPNNALMPLAAVVMEKSQGYPFYLRMMLDTCFRKNCIWYCWKESAWLYDLDRIFAEFGIFNYWTDFIARRLKELPSVSRAILLWASLLGSPFSFTLVQKLLSGEFSYAEDDEEKGDITCVGSTGLEGHSPSDIVGGLQYLLQSYIILPGETDDEYRFAFDSYGQAVATMKECQNQEKMHFIVAQTMMKYACCDDNLYSKAHHICRSAKLIKARVPDRIRYRDVLYQAALAASVSGAKPTALAYFQTCLFLLQDDAWARDVGDAYYEETREIHIQTAETFFAQEQMSEAMELLDVVFANCRTATCRARAWILKSRIFAVSGDLDAALSTLMTSLGELGVKLDTEPTWDDCDAAFMKLSSYLSSTDLDALFARPFSDDRTLVAIGAVMSEAISLCVWGKPLVFFQLAVEMMNIYTFRGAFSQITSLCTHFAMIAISRFNDMALGTRFSDAALAFLSTYKEPSVLARGVTIHNYFVNHLRVPIASMLPVLESSMEAADMLSERHLILINVSAMAYARFSLGHGLAEVEALCNYGLEDITDWASDLRGGINILAVRQVARALQGKTFTDSPDYVTSDDQHDEQKHIANIINRGATCHSLNAYHSMILVPLFLYGHHEKAVELGTKMTQTIHGMWSLRSATMTYFYLSLAILTLSLDNPTRLLDEDTIEQVKKFKAEIDFKRQLCDTNYGMWSLILEALLYEVNDDFQGAMKSFEDALDHSQLHNWPLEEALAYELQVDFLVRRGAKRAAQSLLHRAIASWNTIGATGKAKQLSEKHEWLLSMGAIAKTTDVGCQTVDSLLHGGRGPMAESELMEPEPTNLDPHLEDEHKRKWLEQEHGRADGSLDVSSVGLDIIDLSSILEFSHVMSSELHIDKLLTKMVGIILESCSGADLALVITESESHGWCVAAASDYENGSEAYADGLPFSEVEDKMAQQITHYTLRMQEPALVHNVLEDERFANVSDAYAAKHPQGRAVIALPIIQANNLLGVIHIEGKPNSFTHRNLVVLRLVCNQVGISLANAFLFQEARKVSAANAAMIEQQKRSLAHAREAEQKAKVAEAEAKHNVKLKEDAARAKSIFLANVSHDLRTPMNGVIGLAELLKETKLDEQQDHFVESIRVCADTLLTLINDILDFSKLEAGKMKLSVVPLNLKETIAEVVRALRFTHRDRGLETIEDLDGIDPDLVVLGDPVRLHQIFMNLLSNSYKFTPKGSITVQAKAEDEGADRVRLTSMVVDTGIGISGEHLVRLFRPFSQADSSTARSYGGSGLGLSICKAIIEDVLGGEIWLESEEGVGTTVSLTLSFPKATSKDSTTSTWAPGSDNEPQPQFNNSVRDLTAIPRNQIRVCIAEDNPINQQIAVKFVANLGLTSEVFSDGEQAVEALQQRSREGNPFHLVLMDVQMPVLDGYNATRKIRADSDPNVNEVLVVAMTASAIQGDREKCIEAGMNNYLAKPVTVRVLRATLDQYLAPLIKPIRRGTGSRWNGEKRFVTPPALRPSLSSTSASAGMGRADSNSPSKSRKQSLRPTDEGEEGGNTSARPAEEQNGTPMRVAESNGTTAKPASSEK